MRILAKSRNPLQNTVLGRRHYASCICFIVWVWFSTHMELIWQFISFALNIHLHITFLLCMELVRSLLLSILWFWIQSCEKKWFAVYMCVCLSVYASNANFPKISYKCVQTAASIHTTKYENNEKRTTKIHVSARNSEQNIGEKWNSNVMF